MTHSYALAATPEDIRSLRTRMGLNQKALADLCDVNQATVSRWERGLIPVDRNVQNLLRRVESSYNDAEPEPDKLAALDLHGQWPWLLKLYRSTRNISQEHLAELVDRSVETISRWERGQFAPDLKAQIMLRDLILAPLDSDNVLRKIKTRLETSSGLYNANWGNLVVATSCGLLQNSARRGYPSPQLARVDRIHGGLYANWHSTRTEAGFFRGEVLMSYGFIRVSQDDPRILISLPVTLDTGAVLSMVTHIPCAYSAEHDGQLNIVPCDTAVS